MTKEQKDLLLKDLSARLPYGVKISVNNNVNTLEGIHIPDSVVEFNGCLSCEVEEIKPYLFPMSSMTKEQKKEYKQFLEDIDGYAYSIDCVPQIDWLNAHHFDFRGLISKGLALNAIGLNIY